MTTILTYSELISGAVGAVLLIFVFLFSINLIIKTTGRLKKIAVYFLIGSIAAETYIMGRVINIEVLLPMGKLIGLILVVIVSLLVFLIVLELNRIVKEIIGNKAKPKQKNNVKKETKNKNILRIKEEKTRRRTFAENISNKYLDLTGRKPRFRE